MIVFITTAYRIKDCVLESHDCNLCTVTDVTQFEMTYLYNPPKHIFLYNQHPPPPPSPQIVITPGFLNFQYACNPNKMKKLTYLL